MGLEKASYFIYGFSDRPAGKLSEEQTIEMGIRH